MTEGIDEYFCFENTINQLRAKSQDEFCVSLSVHKERGRREIDEEKGKEER